ncbi:MAG TPA: hypothetical protein VKP30_27035, partial [Polyangiaceae bacterium]|nr:hypothetical protein [Polyangiaceae bacterium]
MPKFAPPVVAPTPELLWSLIRAYGPLDQAVPLASPAARLRVAKQLQLMHRIVSRHHPDVLAEELGATEARQCQASSKRQVMHGLSVLDAERRCTELAEREGIDLALLKFAALHHHCGVS